MGLSDVESPPPSGLHDSGPPGSGSGYGPGTVTANGTGPETPGSPVAQVDTFDLDQLGRKRPDVFPNTAYEFMFCASLLVSMLMAVSPVVHCADPAVALPE